jgi:hypothetical protein
MAPFKRMVYGGRDITTSCTTYIMTLKFPKKEKVNISRMKWAGHVLRMNDEKPTKKLMLGKPDGTRRRGRPKLQWIDGLEKNLHNVSIRKWKNIALDHSRCRRCLEQAKTHPGL